MKLIKIVLAVTVICLISYYGFASVHTKFDVERQKETKLK